MVVLYFSERGVEEGRIAIVQGGAEAVTIADVELLLPIGLLPPEKFSQTGKAATSLQEFVGEEFISSSAAADVDAQTNAQESLELLAKFLRLLQAGRSICCD